ncbi:MAG: serine/threonine-protein kinase [Verrucomicrobiales bacterium]
MAKAMQPTVADTHAHREAEPPTLDELAAAFPDLEILELIGRGGMGAVYKAKQRSLDRFVALKILPQSLAADARFSEYFEREAKALAALNHPNIVTIHDFGRAGGFYFLLMEYVDGVNLRELLRSRRLTPEEALAIVPSLCDALQFAHDRRIVHRDIKPENLLLDRDGRIKVADFGIAKIVGKGEGDGAESAGTPAYMSPEQRETPDKVDSRADIYSLGVVFYEMLTGERPDGALRPPSGKVAIDVRLDEVVLRALQDEPAMRWQTAAELGTRVQTIVSERAAAEEKTDPERPRPKTGGDDWLITCLSCGQAEPYSGQNGQEPDASTDGKREFVHCSHCGMRRKAIVHRSDNASASPGAPPERATSMIGFWSLVGVVLSGLLVFVSIFVVRSSDRLLGSGGSLVVLAFPALLFLGAIWLGWVWLRRLRGSQVSRAAWSLALTVLSFVLPLVLMSTAMLAMFWDQVDLHRDRAMMEQKRALEAVEHNRRISEIELAIMDAQERVEEVEIAALEAERESLVVERDARRPQEARHLDQRVTSVRWLILAVPMLLVIPFGGIGVVLGWRHLVWLRTLKGARPGIFHAMVGALFWPVIITAGLVFTLVLLPLNHGRSANLGLSLGILAAIAASVWLIHATWKWANGEPGSLGISSRVLIGTFLIVAGLLISANMLIDLSDSQQTRSSRRTQQLMQLSQQRMQMESQVFRAEAELDGIEVNEVNAQTEAEKQQFERDKRVPIRDRQLAQAELNRIQSDEMNLREAQMLDDHWWGSALKPILIGLALVIPGILLISRGTRERDALG